MSPTAAFLTHSLEIRLFSQTEPLFHLDRQLFAAFKATGFEHPPSTLSAHAGSKAVHSVAASLLGLIGTFWHDAFS